MKIFAVVTCAALMMGAVWFALPSAPDHALATLVVNSAADTSGLPCTSTCTLRSALQIANGNGVADTIEFDSDYAITPATPLPAFTEANTHVNAVTSGGITHTIKIAGSDAPNHVLDIRANGTWLQNLTVVGAGTGAANVNIEGVISGVRLVNMAVGDDANAGACAQSPNAYFGVRIAGATTPGAGSSNVWLVDSTVTCNQKVGVFISGSKYVQVSGSRVSANGGQGIDVSDGSTGITISDNRVGLGADQVSAQGNGLNGIRLTNGSSASTVSGNTVAGNGLDGVQLDTVHDIKLESNWIGYTADHSAYVANQASGVAIINSYSNTLGSALSASPFLADSISGNGGNGVYIAGAGSHDNRIAGARIIENDKNGIIMQDGATSNTVGINMEGSITTSLSAVEASGNGLNGIHILDSAGNLVQFTTVQANAGDGVLIEGAAATGNEVFAVRASGNGAAGLAEGALAKQNRWHELSFYANRGLGIDKGNDGVATGTQVVIDLVAPARTIKGHTSDGMAGIVDVYRVDSAAGGEGATYIGTAAAGAGGAFAVMETFTRTTRPLAFCYTGVVHLASGSSEFGPPGGPGC